MKKEAFILFFWVVLMVIVFIITDYLTPSTSAFSTFLNNSINETSYFPTYLPAENDTFSTLALQNDTFSFPDQSSLNVSLPTANLSLPDFGELAASFETNETLLQQLLESDLIDNASFDDIGIDLGKLLAHIYLNIIYIFDTLGPL